MEQLATQCPHCGVQFRVTLAQLELRAGQVRCGSCRAVFNGIDTVFEYSAEPHAAPAPSNATQDFSNRMTLFDVGAAGAYPTPSAGSNMQEELDALSRAIADLQSKPWAPPPSSPHNEFADEAELASTASSSAAIAGGSAASTAQAAGAEAPAFARPAPPSRGWRILLWLGLPLLVIALLVQLGWMFRHELAARSPQADRLLRAACARLHCEIKPPLNLEQLAISASRLEQAAPPEVANGVSATAGEDTLQMTLIALLQNTADTVQAWPALELTLRDPNGTLLVKKVFTADTYVGSNELREGMPARSEREIRLPLALTGEPPGGFAVSIFYP